MATDTSTLIEKIKYGATLETPRRFLKFCLVGGAGVVVNMGMLYLFTDIVGLYYLLSSIIAIEIAILNNFFWNDIWTWRDRRKRGGVQFFKRLIKYNISANFSSFVGNIVTLWILTSIFGWYYMYANLVGIMIGVVLNFSLNDRWTYRRGRSQRSIVQ
jgi:dolichol-phosphate mannosyltransferase